MRNQNWILALMKPYGDYIARREREIPAADALNQEY